MVEILEKKNWWLYSSCYCGGVVKRVYKSNYHIFRNVTITIYPKKRVPQFVIEVDYKTYSKGDESELLEALEQLKRERIENKEQKTSKQETELNDEKVDKKED